MARVPFKKELFYSSCLDTPKWVDDMIKRVQEQQERSFMQEVLGVSQFKVRTEDYSDYIDSLRYLSQPVLNPKAVIKLNTKETNKMEAKKCDRCGKLYEQNGDRARVRFKFKEVYGADDLNAEAIAKRQLVDVYIKAWDTELDLCSECKESFKKWWESDNKK